MALKKRVSHDVSDTYTYDAFGSLIYQTGTSGNSFLFQGEQYDAATGLYYLRARYMNPATGTFTSMDAYQGSTSDPMSLHKYLFANANPVMYSDPSGYMALLSVTVGTAINAVMMKVQAAYDKQVIETGMQVIILATALVAMLNSNSANTQAMLIVQSAQNKLNNTSVLATIIDVYLASTAVFINSAVEAVTKFIAEQIKNINKEFSNVSVYVLSNPKDDYDVWYVGISNDPVRRLAEHQNTEKKGWPMHVVATGLTRLAARMLEQVLICAYTLKALENARYEIAEGNYGKFDDEVAQVASLLGIDGAATIYDMIKREKT